ncbi:MAG: ferritin-like domain-containing protein [Elusimicrobia bacterium]|nr:ferritin-like domain-containing protein [Elusimicrobiota bacterium]
MDWSPFVVCAPEEYAPGARGMGGPDGLGDRLRTAAFAERQAFAAFVWAADAFTDASDELRAAWRRIGAEEKVHLDLLLARMAELGVKVEDRPVSDRLWRRLTTAKTAAEFAAMMREAEARGRAAEESFRRSLASRDPVTAAIFGRIADDEAEHLALADRLAAGAAGSDADFPANSEK